MKTSLLRAALGLIFLVNVPRSGAADHRDGPRFVTSIVDRSRDINDLYVFQSPANAANTVIIVTVNPFAGIFSRTTFPTLTDYDINIDNNGDLETDQRFRVTFGRVQKDGSQTYELFHKNGASTPLATAPVGLTSQFTAGQFTCGIFDDPFFFDDVAFRNGANFVDPGTNFFRGTNVLALILEVPSSRLRSAPDRPNIGVWCAARRGTRQVDRMGRPAINTMLITNGNKDRFNSIHPRHDLTNFGAIVVEALMAAPFNRSETDAMSLRNALLPDILQFNTSSSAGFLNGRGLRDDVIDLLLALLTGTPGASDHVASDSSFGSVFPYLQPANP